VRTRINGSTGAIAALLAVLTACSVDGADSAGATDASSSSYDAPAPAPDAQSAPDAPDASDALDASDSGVDAEAGPCVTDGGLPDELLCTGLFSEWGSRTVAPDVKYYDPGFKLWSDGAVKRRWIKLPPQARIDTTDMDEWTFPVGTKLWKEFALGGQVTSEGKLVGGKIIETRLLWKESDTHWSSAVYLWSDDQTSTHRITAGKLVPQPDGGADYEVPSVSACPSCHAGRKDFVLGFEVIGLGVPGAGATGGITLSTLPQGWLTQPPPARTIALPNDASKKAPAALGFLHMNCGVSCHNPAAGAASYTGLHMKLRTAQLFPDAGAPKVSSLDTYQTAVNVKGHLAFGKYMRIAPGDSASSLIPLMALARDPDAGAFLPMPPLLSHRPDPDPATGLPVVQAWIDAL
jgi:hypothetical protein